MPSENSPINVLLPVDFIESGDLGEEDEDGSLSRSDCVDGDVVAVVISVQLDVLDIERRGGELLKELNALIYEERLDDGYDEVERLYRYGWCSTFGAGRGWRISFCGGRESG